MKQQACELPERTVTFEQRPILSVHMWEASPTPTLQLGDVVNHILEI